MSKTRQNIFRFVKGYLPLVNLIRDVEQQISKFLRDTTIASGKRKVFYEIMKTTYSILKSFCSNNDENQRILFPFVKEFFLNELQYDYGQMDLVNAVFQNNRYLCEKERCASIFDEVKKNILQKGRQRRFLEFFKVSLNIFIKLSFNYFKVIQKCGISLIENQIMVANNLLPITNLSDENSLLLYGHFNDMRKSNFEFEFRFQSILDTRDEPFYYHAELLDVFSEALRGSEASNINLTKVQEVLSLKYLFRFLLEDDDLFAKPNDKFKFNVLHNDLPLFYEDFNTLCETNYELITEMNEGAIGLLKPKVLEIVNQVYLSPKNSSIEKIYRNSELFVNFLKNEDNRLNEISNFDMSGPREISYIFDNMLPFIQVYYEKITSNEINTDVIERQDKVSIHSIYQIIQKNMESFKGKLTSKQYKNLKNFLGAIKENDQKGKNGQIDIDFEKPSKLIAKKPEVNNLTLIWEVFINKFLDSSILKKVFKYS